MSNEETADEGRLIDGRYQLTRQLGSGAHGVVWLAEDTKVPRQVALKRVLANDPRPVAERKRSFKGEARALARLHHRNVVILHDIVINENDELWLVMEYVLTGSLADISRMPPERAMRIGEQLADALAAMHRNQMLHCDIKPGNVLLADEDDWVKLSDFGLSRLPEGSMSLPVGSLIVGTPAFMAPEVANGEEPSSASDVFSLGATVYALVEGCSPYGPADNGRPMLNLARREAIIEPRRAGPLAPVLREMLARDPRHRPTADQAKKKLAVIGGRQPVALPRRVFRLPPLPRPSGRVGVATAACSLVGIVLAWVFWPGSPPQTPSSPVVSDQRAVDPCALADADAFSRFGGTDKQDDAGNFNRCDVYVATADGRVDVKVELNTPAEVGGVPQGQVRQSGGLTIVAEPLDDGECDRAIVLSDRNQVDIAASVDQDGQRTKYLCTLADAATKGAVNTLARNGIPRRASLPPSWSWFYVNACGLLDADALAQFPGVAALNPDIGFNNWECVWHSTTSSAFLRVRFDRNGIPTAADGQPVQLAGRSAFVAPNGYGDKTCQVAVIGHQYTDSLAQPTVERLLVVITGPQPVNQLCDQTVAIARSAATKLPS
ncbi:MAG: protein kinase domain-containing protein [Pseudonocardiaceae bacterium]